MAGGSTVIASNGVALPIDSLAVDFTYDGAFLETLTVVYNEITYVQTQANDGTNIVSISQWTPQ